MRDFSGEVKPAGGVALASVLAGLLPYLLFVNAVFSSSTFAWWRWAVACYPAAGLAVALGWVALRRMRDAEANPGFRSLRDSGSALASLCPFWP